MGGKRTAWLRLSVDPGQLGDVGHVPGGVAEPDLVLEHADQALPYPPQMSLADRLTVTEAAGHCLQEAIALRHRQRCHPGGAQALDDEAEHPVIV